MKNSADWERSLGIEEVSYKRFSHKEYRAFLNSSERPLQRQKRAQALLDYLCEKYDIPEAKIYIVEQAQPHNGRTLEALYYFRSCSIRVFNLTAIRQKPVSIKVLAVTILHEFMHHYDRHYLGIRSTPHTHGFFQRIWDLKSKLE